MPGPGHLDTDWKKFGACGWQNGFDRRILREGWDSDFAGEVNATLYLLRLGLKFGHPTTSWPDRRDGEYAASGNQERHRPARLNRRAGATQEL